MVRKFGKVYWFGLSHRCQTTIFSCFLIGVYLGGVDCSIYSDVIFSRPAFDGCMQAVKLKSSLLMPDPLVIPNMVIANISFPEGGVELGCPSNDPCGASPCMFGNCSDDWWAYSCSCPKGRCFISKLLHFSDSPQ